MNRSNAFFLVSALALTPLAPPLAEPLGLGATTDAEDAHAATRSHRERSLGLPSFREVVDEVSPSVVNISTTRQLRPTPMAMPFGLFGSPFGLPPAPQQRPLTQRSLGSGVAVTADGHILTNNHVVQGAEEILVTLADGRAFEAEVIGTDEPTDLAVLRIDDADIPPARLADSDSVEVGDWVLAVGNPFGLGHTVTSGIVGAKQRTGVGINQYEDFLQTDAAINPGNSGGPLIDLDGCIVGINTAIASRSGGNQGIGFAIPADMARRVLDDLLDDGKVERGQLGIYIQDLTPEMAASFDHDGQGVLVTQVVEDSPADSAGLRPGDIVTHVGGRPMTSARELATSVATLPTNEPIRVAYVREGTARTTEATLGQAAPRERPESETLARLGFDVADVDPELARRHGLRAEDGVMVSAVTAGGLAQRAGLGHGDLILAVGDTWISSADECREVLARADLQAGLRLLAESDGQRRFLLLRTSLR